MIDQNYYIRPPDVPDRTSAGGIVCRFSPQDGLVLFAIVREKQRASYVLPKGGVEIGETLEEAARREIGEEAGIHQLKLIRKLGTLERLTFGKTTWSTTHIYLFVTDQVEFQPTDIEHTYTPEWWPLDNLKGMFWPEQQKLLEENNDLIHQSLEPYIKRTSHDQ